MTIQTPAQRSAALVRGVAVPLPTRREGPAKLTGQALYADDLVFPGAWYGATIRSTVPHARLLAIELDPAFDWSKVAVVTSVDIPGRNVVASIAEDQPILVPVGGEIQHQAEPVALLAAADRETLREARKRVTLRTEALPPVFDPLESTVVFAHHELLKGDVDAAFEEDGLEIIEATYRVGHQEQLYIENNAIIAVPREDGGMTVHGSLQCPFYVHKALKTGMNLDDAHTQVVQAETGGGFGGKEEYPSMIALHAALLARKTGRPVRMIYDRHEDLAATTKRHPARDPVPDGDPARRHDRCPGHRSRHGRRRVHDADPGRALARHDPRRRPVRRRERPDPVPRGGHQHAAERRLSRASGRRRSSSRPRCRSRARRRRSGCRRSRSGAGMPTGRAASRPPTSCSAQDVAALEVLERAAEASEFERVRARTASDRAARQPGARTARGIGLALAWHGAGFTGSGEEKMGSVASLERTGDGRLRILTASTEMGQGTKTIFPQLVAAELEIDVDEVEMAPQDTAFVPDSGPTVASRTAMVVGGLLIEAARRLKADVEGRTGRPFGLSWRDDAEAHGYVRIDERFTPYAGRTFDDATYSGDAYPTFGWAAAVAEVEVDLDTAEVTVLSVVAVDDVGHVIHPVLCEGQVEGGTLQAVGYATIEEIKLLDGRYLNDRLQTYIIPTSLDAPRIDTILVEAAFEDAPHHAKGVGELPMDVGAPAVVAAIHDATGAWIDDLPATPERILAALAGIDGPGAPGVSAVSAR